MQSYPSEIGYLGVAVVDLGAVGGRRSISARSNGFNSPQAPPDEPTTHLPSPEVEVDSIKRFVTVAIDDAVHD